MMISFANHQGLGSRVKGLENQSCLTPSPYTLKPKVAAGGRA